jgi:hypothetical protein
LNAPYLERSLAILALAAVPVIGVWLYLSRGIGAAWIGVCLSWFIFVMIRALATPHRWRMYNWLGTNVVMALTPIAIVILVGALRGEQSGIRILGESSEVFLFAALLAAATFGDLFDLVITRRRKHGIHPAVLVSQFLLLMIGMLLLGFMFNQEYTDAPPLLPEKVAVFAMGFALAVMSLSATFRLSLFGARS